jgi:hypothetical protein
MRHARKSRAITLACALLSACQSPKSAPSSNTQPRVKTVVLNPYSPKPADSKLTRGSVEIQHAAIIGLAGKAASTLAIEGNLPTPCHELRLQIPDSPDARRVLRIEAWSVSDPAQMCAQMLQPFSAQIELPAKNEEFTIMLNGQKVGR